MKLDFLTPQKGGESYESRVISSEIVFSAEMINHKIKMFILKHLSYFEEFPSAEIACDGKTVMDLRKEGAGWVLYGWDPIEHKWEFMLEY